MVDDDQGVSQLQTKGKPATENATSTIDKPA